MLRRLAPSAEKSLAAFLPQLKPLSEKTLTMQVPKPKMNRFVPLLLVSAAATVAYLSWEEPVNFSAK